MGPEEAHKNIQKAETPLLGGKVGRVEVVKPEEVKAPGIPYCTLPVPEGASKERQGQTFLADLQLTGQRARVLKWERIGFG